MSSSSSPQPWIGCAHPRSVGLGVLRELNRGALGLLTRCAREYGDFVPLRLGLKRVALISHPRLVEEVLVTRSHDFRKNLAPRLQSSLGNGLLVSDGDFWLRQRRLMQPAFHRQRVEQMATKMVSTVSRTLGEWRPGETHDIYREMMDVSLQIVARTLFGTDVTPDMPIIRRSSRVMTEHLRSRLFTPMMLVPESVPTPGNRRHAAAIRELDALIYRLIAERRRVDTGEDLLGLLLAARDETSRPLSDRQCATKS